MLVKTILRRTLGIKNHVVTKVEWADGGIRIHLDVRGRRRLPCVSCGTLGRLRDRLKERRWKPVPRWGIPVTLVYASARVSCPTCGKIRVEDIPWSQGKCPVSIGLIGLLSAWAKRLAWDVVAKRFGVHWNTAAGAVRQAVAYGLDHRDLGGVLCIGIDELSRRKEHVYVTNV